MNEYLSRAEPSEEKERQKSFENSNLYRTDIAPAIEQDYKKDDVRFEAESYVVMKDLRVVFK